MFRLSLFIWSVLPSFHMCHSIILFLLLSKLRFKNYSFPFHCSSASCPSNVLPLQWNALVHSSLLYQRLFMPCYPPFPCSLLFFFLTFASPCLTNCFPSLSCNLLSPFLYSPSSCFSQFVAPSFPTVLPFSWLVHASVSPKHPFISFTVLESSAFPCALPTLPLKIHSFFLTRLPFPSANYMSGFFPFPTIFNPIIPDFVSFSLFIS